MEDAHCIRRLQLPSHDDYDYSHNKLFAVFDGHAKAAYSALRNSRRALRIPQTQLLDRITHREENTKGDYVGALMKAYLEADEALRSEAV